MLQSEFEDRVGMSISPEEYKAIEVVYINADENVTKDEFCKIWARMNRNRIKAYNEERKKQMKIASLKDYCWSIYGKMKKVDVEKKWKHAIVFLGKRDCVILRKAGVPLDDCDVWAFTERLRNYLEYYI